MTLRPEALSLYEIERRSHRLLIDPLIRQVGKTHLLQNGISFEELYERIILPRYGIRIVDRDDLSTAANGEPAFGVYYPLTNEARIDWTLARSFGDPRRTWTLYHEVCGHGVLQGEHFRRQLDAGDEPIVETNDTLHLRNRDAIERQANAMAGFTAAPLWLVGLQLVYRLKPRDCFFYRGPGTYYIGERRFEVISYEDYLRRLASCIAPWFGGLSVQALSYRVRRVSIVADLTRGSDLRLRPDVGRYTRRPDQPLYRRAGSGRRIPTFGRRIAGALPRYFATMTTPASV